MFNENEINEFLGKIDSIYLENKKFFDSRHLTSEIKAFHDEYSFLVTKNKEAHDFQFKIKKFYENVLLLLEIRRKKKLILIAFSKYKKFKTESFLIEDLKLRFSRLLKTKGQDSKLLVSELNNILFELSEQKFVFRNGEHYFSEAEPIERLLILKKAETDFYNLTLFKLDKILIGLKNNSIFRESYDEIFRWIKEEFLLLKNKMATNQSQNSDYLKNISEFIGVELSFQYLDLKEPCEFNISDKILKKAEEFQQRFTGLKFDEKNTLLNIKQENIQNQKNENSRKLQRINGLITEIENTF